MPVTNPGVQLFTATRIPFAGSDGRLTEDSGLAFDSAADRITTGKVTLSDGQIVFPATQNASADANTLDDYEEGTWTPTLTADGGASGQTYSSNSGAYRKIGSIVYIGARITLSNKGTLTGNVQIAGLPFAQSGSAFQDLYVLYWGSMTSAIVAMVALASGSTSLYLYRTTAAATGMTNVVSGDLSNTSDLIFSGFYRAT
jgi:hypothetical protein